jgi:hypothetical protein
MYHANFPELALQALRDAAEAGAGRIDVVRASVSALCTLAAWAEHQRVDLGSLGVQALATHSWELTPRLRTWLHAAFAAKQVDNAYSLSELPSPAPEVQDGAHVFDQPPLLPELFDAQADAALTWSPGAMGRLVLTGLEPFVQRTPLLRYDTGDLVECLAWVPELGDWSFRPLGRRSDTVFAPLEGRPEPLIFPADLHRIADATPELVRAVHPVEALRVVPPSRLGAPKALARWVGGTLSVALAVDRACPRIASIVDGVRAALIEANPRLARYLENGGHARFEAVEPAELDDGLFKP